MHTHEFVGAFSREVSSVLEQEQDDRFVVAIVGT